MLSKEEENLYATLTHEEKCIYERGLQQKAWNSLPEAYAQQLLLQDEQDDFYSTLSLMPENLAESKDEPLNELIRQAGLLQNYNQDNFINSLDLLKLLTNKSYLTHIKSNTLLILLQKISLYDASQLNITQNKLIMHLSGLLFENLINLEDLNDFIFDVKVKKLFSTITKQDLDFIKQNFADYMQAAIDSIQSLDWHDLRKSLHPQPQSILQALQHSDHASAAKDEEEDHDEGDDHTEMMPTFYSGSGSSFYQPSKKMQSSKWHSDKESHAFSK